MQPNTGPAAPAWRHSHARLATAAVLAILAAFALLATVAAGDASAYTNEWTCKPENDTWCFDPYGLADWHEGQIKLQKGYDAYLCLGITKEGWQGVYVCTSEPVPYGTSFTWKWGTEYSGVDPLHGAGLQDNGHGNAQEIWNWYYEP